MNEWKTIPAGTRICPNLATWRRSDIDDLATYYNCRGHLILEDLTRIECVIGYQLILTLNNEYIIPKFYKEV